jgi:hypothetical protein
VRAHSIFARLILILLSPCAWTQRAQEKDLIDLQDPRNPIFGMHVVRKTFPELRHRAEHRVEAQFRRHLDSFDTKSMRSPLYNGPPIQESDRTSFPLRQRPLFLQPRVYVIDTAIVRSVGDGLNKLVGDTTRQLFSFNTSGKKTSGRIQKWRGDHWTDSLRQTTTYDGNNRMLSDLYEQWTNGHWVNSGRHTCTYDAIGNILTDLRERWSSGLWVVTQSYTYTYDGKNNVTFSSYYWEYSQYPYRYTNTYDERGNRLTFWSEKKMNGRWVTCVRTKWSYAAGSYVIAKFDSSWSEDGHLSYSTHCWYTYGADEHMLLEMDSTWIGSASETPSRTAISIYDTIGNLLEYQEWNWYGDWSNASRERYAYDAYSNQLSGWHDSYYSGSGQWINQDRWSRTYDSNNNQLSELDEKWTNDQWVFVGRLTCGYSSSSNVLSTLREYWNNGQWENGLRSTFAYDSEGNLTSFWSYCWRESTWIPTDLLDTRLASFSFSLTDSAGNVYDFGSGYNVTLTRRLLVAGVTAQSGSVPGIYSLAQNFPNPFNSSTTIKFELSGASHVDLIVCDILGRKVNVLLDEQKNPGVHEVKFNASNLPSGVYFYRLQAGSFTETRKLLLVR